MIKKKLPTMLQANKYYLQYPGKRGNNIIQNINRQLHKHLKDDLKVMIMYQGTKLSWRFQVKGQTKFEHRDDVVYCCECSENDCDDFYNWETDKQIREKLLIIIREIKIPILYEIHKIRNYAHVWVNDFTILNSNYRSKIKMKISESLYIR